LGISVHSLCHAEILPEEARFIKTMHQIFQDMPGASIWPQNDIHLTPTLLHFSNHHTYALQFQPTNPHWQILNEFSSSVYFLEEDEYHLDGIPLSYGDVIDGQSPTYIFSYHEQVNNPERNSFIALHERFHAFQGEHEPFQEYGFNTYPDLNSIENIALSYLELATLKDYWTNHQNESLKDYIAITQFRERALNKDSLDYEIAKEVWEGLANYFAISALPDDSPIKKQGLQTDIDKMCSQDFDQIIACQRQWRYYYTGAIAAFALDNLAIPNWKTQFIEHHLAPRIQLQHFYNMKNEEINRRVQQAQEKFHFDKMMEKIHSIMDEYVRNMNLHLERYEAIEGTKLDLFGGFTRRSTGEVSAEESYHLDGVHQLQVNVTSVDLSSDRLYVMKTHNIPYLLSSNTSTQLKLDAQTEININGQPYQLKDLLGSPQRFDFSSLTITNSYFELQLMTLPGYLDVHDGKIEIRPTQSTYLMKDSSSHRIPSVLSEDKRRELLLGNKDLFKCQTGAKCNYRGNVGSSTLSERTNFIF
jgi:hypothetical protein